MWTLNSQALILRFFFSPYVIHCLFKVIRLKAKLLHVNLNCAYKLHCAPVHDFCVISAILLCSFVMINGIRLTTGRRRTFLDLLLQQGHWSDLGQLDVGVVSQVHVPKRCRVATWECQSGIQRRSSRQDLYFSLCCMKTHRWASGGRIPIF
jgi:hypothetical protein